MKRIIAAAISVFLITANVFANDEVSVYSNGNPVADKGVILEGRTLVPVRGVFEFMGYTVNWDNNTKTATLTNEKKETVIKLTNGATTFTVNDEVITPDVPQQIIDGRFMLPLRAVGEAVNAKVGWNEETKTATINEDNDYIKINPIDENASSIQDMPINQITF